MAEDLEPLPETRKHALWVKRFFAHAGPPDPYVNENGTITLEWGIWGEDYVMLEIGQTKVAILVRPKGEPSWYINGRKADSSE